MRIKKFSGGNSLKPGVMLFNGLDDAYRSTQTQWVNSEYDTGS